MRIDLLVNPFPPQGPNSELAGTETGTGSPADLFLTLMTQIGAMLENAQCQPGNSGKGREPCSDTGRPPAPQDGDLQVDAEPPAPQPQMMVVPAECLPTPDAGNPKTEIASEAAPANGAEIVASPGPAAMLPEMPASDGNPAPGPRPSSSPIEARTSPAPGPQSPKATHPVILNALKAFVVSEVEPPVSKAASGETETVPVSGPPEVKAAPRQAKASPQAAEAGVDFSAAVQDADAGNAAGDPVDEGVLTASPERAARGKSAVLGRPLPELGVPGRKMDSGAATPGPQKSVTDDAPGPADPSPGRTETEQFLRRMAAVSAPDAAGDREAAPKDSGSAPQHEIPDAQPPGKHTARPGIEGQDAAESTHQPVVSPHESGSVSPAKPLQVPDGDRSVREPASGKRAEAPEVISGPHPGSDSKAVTSPRQAAPSAPVRSPDFIIQLAERIRVEAGDGVDGIRIQLKPANLGRVEINAESGVAGVVARIVTESGAVRQFLEGNIQVLEQALQDQGLRVERLDIVMQQSLDLRQSTGNQHGGPGAGHTTGGSDHHSSHGGPMRDLDAIELDPATLVALGPNSTFHTVA